MVVLEKADSTKRIVALAIDYAIIGFSVMIITFAFFIDFENELDLTRLSIFLLFAPPLFFAFKDVVKWQSLGKRIMKIAVKDNFDPKQTFIT